MDDQDYFKRGMDFYSKKDPENAIADFTKVIERMPGFPAAYFLRGASYYVKLDFDRAVVDFQRAVELEPDNAEYREKLAMAKYQAAQRISRRL